MIGDVFTWLNNPTHWKGDPSIGFTGIPGQVANHLYYSGVALLIALALALPAGLLIGHTGRGRALVSAANSLRAVPTVGLIVLLALMISPHFHGRTNTGYIIPTEIVLVIIAIPPILANTYSGIENVDPAVRDGAAGMGMTGSQVLWRVEVPCSLPLIFSGVRSAALQVIATATIASYFPLPGLGRYIYDGLQQQDYPQMVSGGLLVAVTAVLIDSVLALVQRLVVSRGVSGRFSRRAATGGDALSAVSRESDLDDAVEQSSADAAPRSATVG